MTTLMAHLVDAMDEAGEPTLSKAKELLTLILIPQRINSHVINYYLRKALRVGAWRSLSREARALLLVASKVKLKTIKSKTLREILKKIFLEIELHTFRGRAFLEGITYLLRRALDKTLDVLNLLREKTKILLIGIQQLNNPPILRVT